MTFENCDEIHIKKKGKKSALFCYLINPKAPGGISRSNFMHDARYFSHKSLFYPLSCVVLFLEIILIPVYPYLECHSGKALDSNRRNPSSCPDGGKSLTISFLVFVWPLFW